MAIDVKKILGSAYREDITVAELIELLGNDTSMVDIAELNKANAKADKFSKEAGDYRKQLNATKSAEELAQQQREEERQNLLNELETLKKANAINEYEKKLIKGGYDVDLANSSAKALVEGDMDTFFKNQETFNHTQAKKFKEEAVKGMKLPEQTSTNEGMTKEKLLAMPLSKQQEYYDAHPQEYKALFNK